MSGQQGTASSVFKRYLNIFQVVWESSNSKWFKKLAKVAISNLLKHTLLKFKLLKCIKSEYVDHILNS